MLVCIAVSAFGQAQKESELDVGLRYVRGLQQMMFLDIADAVLTDLKAKFPEAATRAAAYELQGELVRGKFDVVKEKIAADEKKSGADSDVVWAMKLALADSYFTYGKYAECSGLYESFFNRFKKETVDPKTKAKKVTMTVPESLQSMYNDAAYKYAQMLLSMKQNEKALDMYRLLIEIKALPEHVRRQCMAEFCEIALSLADVAKTSKEKLDLCNEVDKVCDKLLWVQDLWFGKAIVLKAHVLMLKDKPEEAKELIDRYNGILTKLHMALVEQEQETGEPFVRISPMAECRYLLAVMLQERAEALMAKEDFNINNKEKREEVLALLLGSRKMDGKRKGDGAYNHFVNVYLKYPESSWAADAGQHSEQVRDILVNKFGGNVKSNVTPEQEAKVRAIQYKDARLVYAQGQIELAKERLLQVLNQFPDAPESVLALGDLAKCYMTGMTTDADSAILYADMVIGHLAERYAVPKTMIAAGDMLIALAERWGEYDREDLRIATYKVFFRNYPSHPSCVSYLTSFAEKAYQAEDYSNALDYYTIVANSYSNSPNATIALSRIASVYEKSKDYGKLIPVIDDLVSRLAANPRPVQALYSSRYRRANAIRGQSLEVIKSGTTNEVEMKKAEYNLAMAIKEYDSLIKDLVNPPPTAQVNDEEKKNNSQIREASIFSKAQSLIMVPADDVRKNALREMAIKVYEELVTEYPKSGIAPQALIQIGSLYTMMNKVADADKALSRLRKDYPDSEEARTALPLMAENLMQLGMREEAVARYKEIFSSAGGDYSSYDILKAVRALMASKEYELAKVGLDKIFAAVPKDDITVLPQARFAECRLLINQKNYESALKNLTSFTNDFSRTVLVVDAYGLISEAASMAGLSEKDASRRQDFFDTSILAMKELQKRRTNDLEIARCDLDVGKIMVNKAKAEAEFGNKNKAADYRGQALISFIGFLDSSTSRKPVLQPIVQDTYAEVIPLLMEHKQFEMALENCMEYMRRFPQGKYTSQVNAWMSQAKVELDSKKIQ